MTRRRLPVVLLLAVVAAVAAAQIVPFLKNSSAGPTAAIAAPSIERPQAPTPAEVSARDSEILQKVKDRLQKDPADLEARLLRGLLHFKAGQLELARSELDRLTQSAPMFHLAHLVRGDLLAVQVNRTVDIGQNSLVAGMAERDLAQLERLRTEAEARLRGYLTLIDGQRVPKSLILLSEHIPYAILVDKNQHRLYVYENTGSDRPPRLVADYYCVLGRIPGNKKVRGDQKTPEGVYFVTSRIPGARLPSRYGYVAFPLDYPNAYDARAGKTGDGIWLHGTDEGFYSRPPLDSDGCVVLANDDLQRVMRYIEPGITPVVIAESLEWFSSEEWHLQREKLSALVDRWRRDWEGGRVDDYLRHYAGDFRADGTDLGAWKSHKRRIAGTKEYQKVTLSALSLFAYPLSAGGGREMVLADFQQEYRSNNFNSDTRKRLYLVRDPQEWRIWYEGSR